MTKDEREALAGLAEVTQRLAAAQAQQAEQIAELLAALKPRSAPAEDTKGELALEDMSTVVIHHDSDTPVTLTWNGQRLTVEPGPNRVPYPYAALYRNWQADVEFQKRNERLMRDPRYLSAQLLRMARAEGLETEE
jgi:hypothetical protein